VGGREETLGTGRGLGPHGTIDPPWGVMVHTVLVLRFFHDRTLLLSATIVLAAVGFVACAGGERSNIEATGCANEGDCYLDGFPAGTVCLGGYCIPPEVQRECTSERMCRQSGFPAGTTCVSSRCVPPPVDAAFDRPDAEGVDASAVLPDALFDDAPVSGAP